MRRIGDGERALMVIVSLGIGSVVSSTRSAGLARRPAGNGMGGEGSASSFPALVAKRESGSLSSRDTPPLTEYSGKGLGGDGSGDVACTLTSLCGAEGSLSSSDDEEFFTSTMRPAWKGRGGDGS